eukprot:gene6545-47014_t
MVMSRPHIDPLSFVTKRRLLDSERLEAVAAAAGIALPPVALDRAGHECVVVGGRAGAAADAVERDELEGETPRDECPATPEEFDHHASGGVTPFMLPTRSAKMGCRIRFDDGVEARVPPEVVESVNPGAGGDWRARPFWEGAEHKEAETLTARCYVARRMFERKVGTDLLAPVAHRAPSSAHLAREVLRIYDVDRDGRLDAAEWHEFMMHHVHGLQQMREASDDGFAKAYGGGTAPVGIDPKDLKGIDETKLIAWFDARSPEELEWTDRLEIERRDPPKAIDVAHGLSLQRLQCHLDHDGPVRCRDFVVALSGTPWMVMGLPQDWERASTGMDEWDPANAPVHQMHRIGRPTKFHPFFFINCAMRHLQFGEERAVVELKPEKGHPAAGRYTQVPRHDQSLFGAQFLRDDGTMVATYENDVWVVGHRSGGLGGLGPLGPSPLSLPAAAASGPAGPPAALRRRRGEPSVPVTEVAVSVNAAMWHQVRYVTYYVDRALMKLPRLPRAPRLGGGTMKNYRGLSG